jgi:DNA helicase HerA-like ATPase
MSIGKVLSASTRTATLEIYDPTIPQGTYLELKHPVSPVLAQIVSLARTEKSETADAELLGHSDSRGGTKRVEIPPNIGAEIAHAQSPLIRDVLGVSARTTTSLYIGRLLGHPDIRVNVDYRPIISQHLAVIAKTGGGKSYTVGVMIEELMKRGVPVIVIDPHGEYVQTAYQNDNHNDLRRMAAYGVFPRGYYDRITEYSPDTETNKSAMPLRFDERNLDVDDIMAISTLGDSEAQRSMLERAMYSLQQRGLENTFAHLIEEVAREKSQAKYRLIRELYRLRTLPLFQDIPTKLSNIVRRNTMTIINLKGATEDVQCLCAARITKRIFEEAKRNSNFPSCFVVVEEAHNFVPEMERTIASRPITVIAQEGRKFGVGLCVVSQRTARVSKNVLAQCGSFIIHKLTNTEDLKAVSESLEGFTAPMVDEVQRLPIGVALVSTLGLPHPIIAEVRPRESKHGGVSRGI